LQGFPDEDISMSEVLDMVCAVESSENTDEDDIVE
jgi:hypothetical protein